MSSTDTLTLSPSTTEDPTEEQAPLLERLFDFVPGEASYTIEEIEGRVPGYLRGTYYVNGPARFERGGVSYRHWLDGDGMVCALKFAGDGGAHLTHRFVESTKLAEEGETGEAIYRAFGTAFPGDRLKRGIGLESPVNVSVHAYGGKLLAFGEQGLPWELDPQTLETRGEFTFDGRLNAISPLSAHPCFDRESGEMFNFGVSFARSRPCLHLYRFAEDRPGGPRLLYRKRLALDFPTMVHDFALSPSYAIFYLSPHLLDVEAVMNEGKSVMEALSWEPWRGSRLLIVRRETGEVAATIPVGSRYCLHLANSFEENGKLFLDLLELDGPVYDQYQEIPNLFTDVAEGRPVRLEIDTGSWTLAAECSLDYSLAPDFPAIDPRLAGERAQDVWVLGISKTGRPGRKLFDQLAHLSWATGGMADVWQAPPESYLGGEPVFLPDPGDPNAGTVCVQLFDARERASAFLLFNAFDVAAGPVARLQLREPIPPLFHASWDPANG